MTPLAGWLIGKGLSSRLAKGIEWALAGIIALTLIAGVWIAVAHGYASHVDSLKQEAIEDHDKDVSLEVYNRLTAAERAATANQTANASVFANAQEELRDEARDKGTAAPAGPAVAGVLERMRAQQAAGRR